MKYLKLFENHSEYEGFVSGGTMEKPNVSHCVQENEVHYTPHTWADEYLIFDIIEGGTIVWKAATTATTVATISYKLNDGDWTEITSSTAGTSFNVSDGDKVRFKGSNAQYATSNSKYNSFRGSTASFNVKGNIMSLINGDSFANATTLESDYTFIRLFVNTNIVNAKKLVLPATTLANYCYAYMFAGCTSLTVVPELPATTLANSCYLGIFANCTNLTVGTELPATALTYQCYEGMFSGCENLTIAPELPATTLAKYCYASMFLGCTSLVTAPELPATTLGEGCYVFMFTNCQNLANVPSILPATTLADASGEYDGCYLSMFNGCTSLTTAPELPATTLTKYCYRFMFSGCTSLNSITCLATNISATDCTTNWVNGVASNGTFTKAASMNDWTTGVDGIPNNWTTQDAS